MQAGFKRSVDGRVTLKARDGHWFNVKADLQVRCRGGLGKASVHVRMMGGGARSDGGNVCLMEGVNMSVCGKCVCVCVCVCVCARCAAFWGGGES